MNDVSNKSGASIAPALIRLLLASVGMFLLILLGFSGAASAASTFVVNTESDATDSRPGDGVCLNDVLDKCSLRAAIMESNELDGADTIHLPEGTYRLMLGGPQEDNGLTGDLDILGDLTIIGSGGNANGNPASTVIDGAGIDRVLAINPEATLDLHVEIKAVTITNGISSFETLYSDSIGGGILGDAGNGSLVIYNSIISNNAADSTTPNYGVGGGAMLYGLSDGTIRIENSTITNNSAHNYGGGLTISADSNVQIVNSTISGNTAGQGYGGLNFAGAGYGTVKGASIENSTISGNTAEENGGGIGLNAKAELKNVTISGNTSKMNGGGLYIRNSSGNPVTMTNLTITDNQANLGGSGLYAMQGDIIMHNSIVAGNQSDDIGGSTPFHSTSSNNLAGTVSNGGLTNGVNGNIVSQSPKLGPLANNGGKTKTHALLNGSPAIDTGDNTKADEAGITSDQRGASRVVDSSDENSDETIDIGAYEAHATISDIQDVTTSVNTTKNVTANVGSSSSIDVTASSSNQTLIPNGNITVEGTGPTRTIKVTPAAGQSGKATITVSVSDKVGGPDAVDTFEVNVVAAPDLTITKSHTGDFYKGQTGATYTIRVTNAGIDPTSGTVTVTDTLPSGLTTTAISGAFWTCDHDTLTCTRGDALASGASYPDITVIVNVATNAPASVTNTASVTGGNDVNTDNNSASDVTTVIDNAHIDSVNGPANRTYRAGEVMNFTVNYSQKIEVNTTNGTPSIPLTIGTKTAHASYADGTGTKSISFRYTVQAGESDTDGIALGTALSLNGGTMKDTVTGKDADPALNGIPDTSGVKVDAVAPEVVSVTFPADKKYGVGQALAFTVKFNEPVTVTGTPTIDLVIGSKTVQASFLSGTGTDSLVFQYMVQAGDTDDNGIDLGILELNGGSIRDAVGNDAALTLNGIGSTDHVIVDTSAPSVQSVSVPLDGSYHAGEVLSFTVIYDDAITVAGGTPSIPLSIGGVAKQANYQSGTGTSALLFQYTVQPGDWDTDGIEPGSVIALNGASFKDGAGNDAKLELTGMPSRPNVLIDSTSPMIDTVAVPPPATYRIGQDLEFNVTFSENVLVETSGGTPHLLLVIGTNNVQAEYTAGSGSNTLEFRYTVRAGDADANGITVSAMALNGGTIQDAAGNNAAIALNSVAPTDGVLVDAAVPTVTSVSVPTVKTYADGENLDFTVTLSENVNVDLTDGDPSIEITIGTASKHAVYVSGTGTNALKFRYEVQAGDLDADGISLANSISLNGSSIRDSSGYDTILTLNGVPNTAGVFVDAVAPHVNSVNVPVSRTYSAGENLDFTLNFNEIVTVTAPGEAPFVQLVIGNTTAEAPYLSGSGSSALVFRYTVKNGENDADGIELKPVLHLNGSSIRDSVGNDAVVALTGIGNTSDILIDTTVPGTSGVTVPTDGSYRQGDRLQISVTFSEPVTVAGGTPTIPLMIGGTPRDADYQSGSDTDTLNFSYTVQTEDEDGDGIEIGNAITLKGSTITDTAGHPAPLTINPGPTPGVLVDNTPPNVPTIDITNGAWFNKSEILFQGSGDADTTIEIVVDSASKGTGMTGADGKWNVKVTGLTEGPHTLKAISKDAAGNASESLSHTFSVDLTVPAKPTIALSETDWTNQDVKVTITGESGNIIQYKVDQGAWTDYAGTVTISKEGETEFYARQSDSSQNVSEEEKAVVRIDKTAPVITLKGAASMTIYRGAAFTDPGVTINDLYAPGLTPNITGSVDTSTLGTYTLQYDAADLAGNQANAVTRTVRVVNRPIDPPVTYPVTGVSLDQEKLTLSPDDAPVALHATVKPEYATNKAVVWSSSDPDVAEVDSDGRVTAKKAGKATITVTTVDGNKTASCEVTVKEKSSLHLKASPSSFKLQPEESTRFRVYAVEGEKRTDITTDKETSYSIDNDLVSVKRGQITAGKAEGESIITVTYRGEEVTIPVTIEKEAFRLEVSEMSFLLKPKGTARFKVYAINGKKREDITNDKATSYSTDNDLITVKQGRITAGKEEGESEITVSYEGKEVTIPVTISKVTVKSLTASLKQAVLEVDEDRQLKVTASLSDGNRKDVTDQAHWFSNDSDVVEVTDEGEIIASQSGTAAITAKFGGKQVVFRVLVVEEKKPRLLMVNRSSLRLEAGQTVSLVVNASYEKGYKEEITSDAEYVSNDPAIATAENGRITAGAEGRTTVIVSYEGKKVTIYVTVRK